MAPTEEEELEAYENREVIVKPGKINKVCLINEIGVIFENIEGLSVDIKQEDGILKIWFSEDK